jgi:hypothetical protein
MPQHRQSPAQRRTRGPLYHSAKIAEATFLRVLHHFVRDDSATQTARQTGLSLNSTSALFQKIRAYFFYSGVFTDPYRGKPPSEAGLDNDAFEARLLSYHFARIAQKRGLAPSDATADYHLAESHWRFMFHVAKAGRPEADFHQMMFSHLVEIIRLCGPIGRLPANRAAGLRAALRHQDQLLAWLERNAPGFSDDERARIRDIRSTPVSDPSSP